MDMDMDIYYKDDWGQAYIVDVKFIKLVCVKGGHIDSPINPDNAKLWFECILYIYDASNRYGNDKCHVIINTDITTCTGVDFDGTKIYGYKAMSEGLRKLVAEKLQEQLSGI
jgi:hypothetical protein